MIPVRNVGKVREIEREGNEDDPSTRQRRIRGMNVWFAKNISRAKEMLPEPYASHLAPLVTSLTTRAVYLTLATPCCGW